MEDKRRRLYEIVLYEGMIDVIYLATELNKCKYYWTYHDKDKYDNDTENHKKGDLKKPHWHLLLYFNDGITLKSLCNKLSIEGQENLVSFWPAKDPDGRKDHRVRYLIHYKSKDEFKYEYSIDDIHTNDDDINKFFIDEESKQNKDIILLFDFFDSRQGCLISYRTFLNFVYEQSLWGTYQRNASIFNRLFDEHNSSAKAEALEIFKVS